jgi:hypothetical protein
MRKLLYVILILLPLNLALADKKHDEDIRRRLSPSEWPPPSEEYLRQKFCPLDSTANSMVIYKEMKLYYNLPKLTVEEFKRIKIYTDDGLSYAQVKEIYGGDVVIDTIYGVCYGPDGQVSKLSLEDIFDETLIVNEKVELNIKSKSFVIPNVVPGCVIDYCIVKSSKKALSPPVFRFHEYIPVLDANFEMNSPGLMVDYVVTNKELIYPKTDFKEGIFYFRADSIPAIKDEILRLPDRNLVSDLWIQFKDFWSYFTQSSQADKWGALAGIFNNEYEDAMSNTFRADKIADSLKTVAKDPMEQIKSAYEIVRDRWSNSDFPFIGGPKEDVNKLTKKRELDSESKALVLCAILRSLGRRDAEIIWVGSDKCEYSPVQKFPSLLMFDRALVYLESDSLYFDPADPGGELGVLDESLLERLACRPMAKKDYLINTPKTDKYCSKIINMKLNIGDNDEIFGDAAILFENQAAILARRDYREKGEMEMTAYLDSILFRNSVRGVKSFAVAEESNQTPDKFGLSCQIEIPEFFNGDNGELDVYPGPTFKYTVLDEDGPRKYPVYFDSRDFDVYSVEWNLGERYAPVKIESLNSNIDGTVMRLTSMAEYDSLAHLLSFRRQYKMTQRMVRPELVSILNNFFQGAQKCDLTTITLEKR